MNADKIIQNVEVERRENEVAVVVPIGPATITVELPSWAVGMAVNRLRSGVDEAATEYHELLDKVEEAAQ